MSRGTLTMTFLIHTFFKKNYHELQFHAEERKQIKLVSGSTDRATNFKTVNPDSHKYFGQLE